MTELVKLRSINSHFPSFVKFVNKASDSVSLEWLSFSGSHVVYHEAMLPGEEMQMNTYKGHPWVFYDSELRHPRVVLPDRERIFFPAEYIDGPVVYKPIYIVSPLLSLRQTCLNYIHRYIHSQLDCKEPEEIMRKADAMKVRRLVVKEDAESLKKMAENQRNFDEPVYVPPHYLE